MGVVKVHVDDELIVVVARFALFRWLDQFECLLMRTTSIAFWLNLDINTHLAGICVVDGAHVVCVLAKLTSTHTFGCAARRPFGSIGRVLLAEFVALLFSAR